MTLDELRLECLRLAQTGATANSIFAEDAAVVNRARKYYDFVIGKNDAEIIGVVHELAKKILA